MTRYTERIKALDAEIGRLLYNEGAHHPRLKTLMEEQARLEKLEAAENAAHGLAGKGAAHQPVAKGA